MKSARARAGDVLVLAPLDDDHVDPRQGELGREHHPRRSAARDHHRMLRPRRHRGSMWATTGALPQAGAKVHSGDAMGFQHLLGRVAQLSIRRFASPGAYLAVDPSDRSERAETILLPGAEIPEGAEEGDELAVFVHLDSEDRPIATTRAPKLELGEVRFLEVSDVTSFGAFVDWGLPKELLVPHKEQTRDLHRGDFHAIGLFLDDTGRLAGTMRVSEMLREKGEFDLDEWVEGEAWR